MHLDLTDEQAEAVRSALFFSHRSLKGFLNSDRAKHQEQVEWAARRVEVLEQIQEITGLPTELKDRKGMNR